jgi:hypothetical protein
LLFAAKDLFAKRECEARGRKIDVRPNWKEQPERPSLTGKQAMLLKRHPEGHTYFPVLAHEGHTFHMRPNGRAGGDEQTFGAE